MPWNLEIGEMAAVGDHAILYALGSIHIGPRATISQYAHLCAGTHDISRTDRPLLKLPISIGADAWVAADAFVGPGVSIGPHAIVGARAVVIKDILVDGATADLSGEIIDDNLNSLTWWTEKHNSYASREVVDLLNLEYGFMPHETVANLSGGQQAGVKRWLKERVYAKLPGGIRAFVYFAYRYVVRLGFLDRKEGTAFHVLQGFWYRYLVDMKLYEVRTYMKVHDADVVDAIRDVLGITIHVDVTDRD